MRYLALYESWTQDNWYPFLCQQFTDNDLFDLFKPTYKELQESIGDGYCPKDQDDLDTYGTDCAWGSFANGPSSAATPLRQNILLLMAAMNGEL